MTRKRHFETPATIALGVVCTVLFLRLALRVRDVNARAEQPVVAPALRDLHERAMVPRKIVPEAFPDGPVLDVELYERGRSQPIDAAPRDPFAFEPTPQQVQQQHALQVKAAAAAAQRNAASASPSLPSLPFQALGYSQGVEGNLQAYLADDQQVYVVHQGDRFDKSYTVLSITSQKIILRDELYNRTVELPFPAP